MTKLIEGRKTDNLGTYYSQWFYHKSANRSFKHRITLLIETGLLFAVLLSSFAGKQSYAY